MAIEDMMRRYYEIYNSEDAEALAAFYHPGVQLTSAEGVLDGAQAILSTYCSITSRFRDQMQPESITVDGDVAHVVIRDRFTAREDVADFMGMSLAKGDAFELRLQGTYLVEDGKFRSITIEPCSD